LLIFLTGCYDYRELNSIAIISAESIDYVNGEFLISVQVLNPQAPEKTTTVQAPFIIYSGTGKTIQEAYLNITSKTSRDLYANHLQLLLLSNEVASNHLDDVIDYYSRNPLIRTEFNVLVIHDENPIGMITPIEEISASSFVDTININSHNYGTSLCVTFNDLLKWYLDPNIEIVLPAIKIIKNSDEMNSSENTSSSYVKSLYEINGLSLFKNNKIIGYLDKFQTISFNFVRGNIKNTTFSYECEKGKYITYEILNSNSKINISDKNVIFKFNIYANINESQCNIDLSNIDTINKIQNDTSLYFNKFIMDNISIINKKYSHDVFGLKDYIYKNNHDLYIRIKDNYDDFYKNLNINIESNFNIISEGNILGGLNEKN